MTMVNRLALLLALVPALADAATGSAAVDTWYVRPAGACANNGDGLAYACAASAGAAGAFIGITNIITTGTVGVDDGDTMYVCGAHSLGSDTFTQFGSGTGGTYITISFACPGDTGSMTTDGTQVNGVFVNGKAYLNFIDVRLSGNTLNTGNSPGLFSIDSTSSFITLTNPTISGNANSRLLHIRTSDDITVTTPALSDGGSHCLWVTGSDTDRVTITGGSTRDCDRTGVRVEGNVANTEVDTVTISGVEASGNGDGIYVIKSRNVVIDDVNSHENRNETLSSSFQEGYGIAVQQSDNVTIRYSTSSRNRTDGIEIWGNAAINSLNADIFGNLVYGHVYFTADDSGSNGIECRTGYADCNIYSNIVVDNTKNIRIGNSPITTSYLANNVISGGSYGVRMVDSSEAGTNATTGWEIRNNVIQSASTWLLYTDVTSGNSNTFGTNDWVGSGNVVTYDASTYTTTTVSAVDSTRLDNVTPAFACSDLSDENCAKTLGASALRRAGACITGVPSCIFPDFDGTRFELKRGKPNIGAYQDGVSKGSGRFLLPGVR